MYELGDTIKHTLTKEKYFVYNTFSGVEDLFIRRVDIKRNENNPVFPVMKRTIYVSHTRILLLEKSPIWKKQR